MPLADDDPLVELPARVVDEPGGADEVPSLAVTPVLQPHPLVAVAVAELVHAEPVVMPADKIAWMITKK